VKREYSEKNWGKRGFAIPEAEIFGRSLMFKRIKEKRRMERE
jgi:hypothetical protein